MATCQTPLLDLDYQNHNRTFQLKKAYKNFTNFTPNPKRDLFIMKKPANNIIIKLFKSNMGNKTEVASSLNVSRQALYNWIESDKDLKAAINQQEESNIDFVESKLFEKIQGVETVKTNANGDDVYYSLPPSDTAIIFFLKTRAKNRGYVERQEITGKDGKNLVIGGFEYIVPQSENGSNKAKDKTNGQATPRIHSPAK